VGASNVWAQDLTRGEHHELLSPSEETSYHNGVMRHSQETTWERNAPSQVVLNSIFAALDGALIVIIIIPPDSQASGSRFWSLFLLVASFCFFAVSAEKTVVALEERDVKKYAYYLLPYNLGVICTGVAIELMMYAQFGSAVRSRMASYFGNCSGWFSALAWFIAAVIFLRIWIYDLCWLLFASKKRFQQWLEELVLTPAKK
jgi:hypothetical protein